VTVVGFEPRRSARPGTENRKPSMPLRVDGWALDLDSRKVVTSQGQKKLTPKLCRLLEVFIRNRGKILTREFLMKEVWETDYVGDTRTLEVHVCWLRQKIEEDPREPKYLRTVHRVGYLLDLPRQS
jgi:two-component system alkaline phosphatase synthesis response regulator PhoP